MIWTLALAFLGGLLAGNAVPHFVRGITRQRCPNALGGGPVPNVVAGWAGLVLAVVALHAAFHVREPLWPFCAAALGAVCLRLMK